MIFLLDVDETLAIGNTHYGQHDGGYRYNDFLIQALQKAGVKSCYLFTNYSLEIVAKKQEDEKIGAPSRAKLMEHLEKNKIQVLGVITPYDHAYEKGPGAYYAEVIAPFERSVLAGNDLKDSQDYTDGFLAENNKLQTDKGQMYVDLIESLKHKDAKLLKGGVGFADDSKSYINQVETAHAKQQYQHVLRCLQVKPDMTLADYQDWIQTLQPKSVWSVVFAQIVSGLSKFFAQLWAWMRGSSSARDQQSSTPEVKERIFSKGLMHEGSDLQHNKVSKIQKHRRKSVGDVPNNTAPLASKDQHSRTSSVSSAPLKTAPITMEDAHPNLTREKSVPTQKK